MTDNPWYKTFFGEDYLRLYEPILTPERTQRDVDGIVNMLALPQGSSILDLCCGHGRHAIPLAQHGYKVTGQDLSEVFLREAEKEAMGKGVHVDWLHGDMRNIPFENEFDAVINIFTAFGYLENQDEDQQVLNQIYKALKPGGLFLLEIIHREGLMRRFSPHMIEYHPDGRRKEYGHAARVYTLTELAQMLTMAGLQVKAYFGALDGRELTIDSFRLILLGQKVG